MADGIDVVRRVRRPPDGGRVPPAGEGSATGAAPPGWLARHRWQRVLGPLVVLAAWWIASGTGLVDPRFLSTPPQVFDVFVAEARAGTLQAALAVSLGRVAKGLAIGVAAGVAIGVAAGISRRGEDVLDSALQMLRTIPFIALTSLFVVWFGIGEAPKVALVALATFFPIYLNVHNGIRNVDARLVEAAQSFGLKRWGIVREVVLPGALPQALLGLRIAMGVSWLALVAAEQINSSSGVGALLSNAQNDLNSAGVVAGIVTYAGLGIVTDLVVRLLEKRLLVWRRGFAGA